MTVSARILLYESPGGNQVDGLPYPFWLKVDGLVWIKPPSVAHTASELFWYTPQE